MSSVLCIATDAELDNCRFQADMTNRIVPTIEESYATTPMAAVSVARNVLYDDEELHTSFEQAISVRVMAVQGQLSRISGPLRYSRPLQYETEPIVVPVKQEKLRNVGRVLRRSILFGGLSLMFTLLGFDVMGLLILHIR